MNFNIKPATRDDVRWIANLEQQTYSGIDVIPFATLSDWYQTNPNIFYLISDENGNQAGHIDVLPLRPEILQQFIKGEITERDIPGEGLFTPDEKGQIADLYIESVAIPYLKGYARACALRDALTGISKIIINLCNPDLNTTLYAMPASPEGLKLMERMNFRLFIDGPSRKDGHSMYKVQFHDFSV